MDEDSIKNAANVGVRSPVTSGKRGARPFLFQTKRGLQIVQDGLDESASSDNETLGNMAAKVKLKNVYEEREDSEPIAKVMKEEERDRRPIRAPGRQTVEKATPSFGSQGHRGTLNQCLSCEAMHDKSMTAVRERNAESVLIP